MDHGSLLVLDTPEALKRRLGAGDVLEIDLESAEPAIRDALPLVRSLFPQATMQDHTLVVRSLAVIEKLPDLVQQLTKAGIAYSNIHLRGNTLEDVFIALTGRRLRE